MKFAKLTRRALPEFVMRRIAMATAIPISLLVINILSAMPVQAAETIVKIENFTFNPQRVTIKAGTVVTWVNADDIPHTATSKAKLFKSKALDTDEKFSFTFQQPGTYEYFCSLHPHMTGSIVVEAQ